MADACTIAECITGPVRDRLIEVEGLVKDVKLYAAESGGWIYEVWIARRPVVIGWCHTREVAEAEASLA